MPKSRKMLWRNKEFAKRAERHEDIKGETEALNKELKKLDLLKEMYERYGRSKTIGVFKSPRGLMAQLIVARIQIALDVARLRKVLGPEFKYPLVRKQVEYVVDPVVLKKRIRQKRLPKEVVDVLTKEKLTFNTYTPKSKTSGKGHKQE